MAASFRFSQIPGSSNSSLLITRENVELFWDASIDLADSLSRAEQSLVTIDLDTSPTGNFTLTELTRINKKPKLYLLDVSKIIIKNIR